MPLKPFAGTIGIAPAEPGLHSVVPPRRVGGNLDIRDLAAGTVLYLPVEVAGALFSVGDTHAAQGDGEVCGTAIESPMNVVLSSIWSRTPSCKTPRFTTPGPVTRHLDAKGYEVTTGIGPDLMDGRAGRGRADDRPPRPAATASTPVDAYMLCSVCGDLRISEIVDMPNWVVSFYFPRCVLRVTAAAGTGPARGCGPAATATAGPVLAVSGLAVAVRGEDGARPVVVRPLLRRSRAARRSASPANPAPASR